MSWFDSLMALMIILFGILIVWTKISQQRMIDTLNEIKEFVQSTKESN